MSDSTALDQMSRADLETHAATVGVDPREHRKIDDLRAAILVAGEPTTGATEAGVNSPNQDSGVVQTLTLGNDADTVDVQPEQRIGVYIVNGVEVDPNGKPLDSK